MPIENILDNLSQISSNESCEVIRLGEDDTLDEDQIETAFEHAPNNNAKKILDDYVIWKDQKRRREENVSIITEHIKRNHYVSEKNPFIMMPDNPNQFDLCLQKEKAFRASHAIYHNTPFFVINNHSNVHWDATFIQDETESGRIQLNASGEENSCGAYTVINIIKNHEKFLQLDIVQRIAKEVFKVSSFTSNTLTNNPAEVRKFLEIAINFYKDQLSGIPGKEQTIQAMNNSLQRIIQPETMLLIEDIQYVFEALNIPIYHLKAFEIKENADESELNLIKRNTLINLLGKAEENSIKNQQAEIAEFAKFFEEGKTNGKYQDLDFSKIIEQIQQESNFYDNSSYLSITKKEVDSSTNEKYLMKNNVTTNKKQEKTNMPSLNDNITQDQILTEIENKVSKFKDILSSSNIENEEIIILYGNTGSGKSTLLEYLSGKELIGKELESGDLAVAYRIPPADKKEDAICHNSAESGTDVPRRVEVKPSGIIPGASNNLVFWDFPGANDTRGIINIIVRAYCLKEIVSRAKGAKIVLVVSQGSFSSDKSNSFKNALTELFKIFPRDNINILRRILSMLVTSADGIKHTSNILHHVKSLITSLGKTSSIDPQSKENYELCENIKSLFKGYFEEDEECEELKLGRVTFGVVAKPKVLDNAVEWDRKSLLEPIEIKDYESKFPIEIAIPKESGELLLKLSERMEISLKEDFKLIKDEFIKFFNSFNIKELKNLENLKIIRNVLNEFVSKKITDDNSLIEQLNSCIVSSRSFVEINSHVLNKTKKDIDTLIGFKNSFAETTYDYFLKVFNRFEEFKMYLNDALNKANNLIQIKGEEMHKKELDDAKQKAKEALDAKNLADRQRQDAENVADNARREADRQRQEAENARREMDRQRQEAENARREADRQRQEAENTRREMDRQRQEAENARREADRQRQEAENTRREMDRQRQDAENVADNARRETDRQRQEAENARREMDRQRQEAENARREADKQRQEAENARRKADKQRKEARKARRKADKQKAKKAADSTSESSTSSNSEDYSLQRQPHHCILNMYPHNRRILEHRDGTKSEFVDYPVSDKRGKIVDSMPFDVDKKEYRPDLRNRPDLR